MIVQFLFLILIGCTSSFTAFAQQKEVVFVLGMHRSGTSAAAGTLYHLGVPLGENLIGASANNAKGHFEHQATYELNEKILKKINTTWHDVKPLNFDWNCARANELKNTIKKHLAHYFGSFSFFGLKEPRLCLLLPLYLAAAKELGYTPKLIIILRNPAEVAASLNKGWSIPFEQGLALTQKYLALLRDNTKGYQKLVISFDMLINHSDWVIDLVSSLLPSLTITPEARQRALDFIDKDLKHHTRQRYQTLLFEA